MIKEGGKCTFVSQGFSAVSSEIAFFLKNLDHHILKCRTTFQTPQPSLILGRSEMSGFRKAIKKIDREYSRINNKI